MCDLAPMYTIVQHGRHKINASDYGKTLGEMGFRNHDIITVRKNNVDDKSVQYPLVTAEKDKLSDRAFVIFNHWFDIFSEQPERNHISPNSATFFIKGATGEDVIPTEHRIKGLFDAHCAAKDDKMLREEFLQFYFEASRDRPDRVIENLRSMFVRADLLRKAEVQEDFLFPQAQMPRYTLSSDQKQFDTLFSLLDNSEHGDDESASLQEEVWSLICMLETNDNMYTQVLTL